MASLKQCRFNSAREAREFKEALRERGIYYVYWMDNGVHVVALRAVSLY